MPRMKKPSAKINTKLPTKKSILDFLSKRGGCCDKVEIVKQFGLKERKERKECEEKISSLESKGLVQVEENKIYLIQKGGEFLEGKVSTHPRGFAFLVTEEGVPDVFLPPREARKVLNGDRALIRLINQRKNNKVYGRIVKVLKIRHEVIIGRYETDEFGRLLFVPAGGGKSPIRLRRPQRRKSVDSGQLLSVKVHRDSNGLVSSIAEIQEKLGDLSSKGVPQKIAIVNNGIRDGWSEEIKKEALELHRRNEKEIAGRRRKDLRSLPFITIDGKDAKDFDDAVYAEKSEDGYSLSVAIADVSFYVKAGSSLDREAFERGNSVYFSQSVIPMLPEKLSNELCSLLPDEDRLVLVVRLKISNTGRLQEFEFSEGVINSKKRFTYDEVQSIYDDGLNTANIPNIVLENLIHLKEVYDALAHARSERKGLSLDGPEIRYDFDKGGRITSIQLVPRKDSQKVIEECMIAANVAAAKFFNESETLYRHHPEPEPEKIEELRQEAKRIGFITSPALDDSVTVCNRLLELAGKSKERLLIESMVMRAQKLASYSSSERSHFGLSLSHYTHFTSPIRRYSDLIVHRLIKKKLRNSRSYDEVGLSTESVAVQCSSCERRAEEATREEMAYLKCEFMSRQIGRSHSAIVVSVLDSGMYAQILSNAVEGFIPLERQFTNDANMKKLPDIYSLGQHILIEVEEVDVLARKIFFKLASSKPIAKKEQR